MRREKSRKGRERENLRRKSDTSLSRVILKGSGVMLARTEQENELAQAC